MNLEGPVCFSDSEPADAPFVLLSNMTRVGETSLQSDAQKQRVHAWSRLCLRLCPPCVHHFSHRSHRQPKPTSLRVMSGTKQSSIGTKSSKVESSSDSKRDFHGTDAAVHDDRDVSPSKRGVHAPDRSADEFSSSKQQQQNQGGAARQRN